MNAPTDAEIRRLVVDALEGATVDRIRRDPRIGAFLGGQLDVPLDELEMDSLDVMEFCIAIELSTGVSVVPDELGRLATLAGVAESIRRRRA